MIRRQYRKLTKRERFWQRFLSALGPRARVAGAWAAILFVLLAELYFRQLQVQP